MRPIPPVAHSINILTKRLSTVVAQRARCKSTRLMLISQKTTPEEVFVQRRKSLGVVKQGLGPSHLNRAYQIGSS